MRELLLHQSNLTRRLYLLSVVCAMLLMPLGAWAQSEYGLTIAGIPVTSQNAGGITGDGITGTVTYNADQHALTLEGATIAFAGIVFYWCHRHLNTVRRS